MKPRLWVDHVHSQSEGRPFMVYWSDELGYGRIHPTPSSGELERFYTAGEYSSYLGGRDSDKDERPFSISRKLLFRLASRVDQGHDFSAKELHTLLAGTPGRVCEIGCASGAVLEELRALGHEVYGIEPAAAGREVARARGLTVDAGTAEEPPADAPFGTFDCVLMLQSLEHCLDPVRAVQNVARLLRPGGLFVCDVPNAECARFTQAGEAWFHLDPGRHISYFTARSLEQLARLGGLVPGRISYAGYVRQFAWLESEQAVWDSLNAKVPANARKNATARPSELGLWTLAARTLLGGPALRYDSVGILARKPAHAS